MSVVLTDVKLYTFFYEKLFGHRAIAFERHGGSRLGWQNPRDTRARP
jgi:hypothetical protein